MTNKKRQYKELYQPDIYSKFIDQEKLTENQKKDILKILKGRSSELQKKQTLEIMERGLLDKSLVKSGPKKNTKLELTEPLEQLESCLGKAIAAIDSLPSFEKKMLEHEFLVINGEMLNGGRNGTFYDDTGEIERVVFKNADNWTKILIKMYNATRVRKQDINESWTKEDHTYTKIYIDFTRSFQHIFPNEKVRVPFSNDKFHLYGDLVKYFTLNILEIPFSPQKYIKKTLKHL